MADSHEHGGRDRFGWLLIGVLVFGVVVFIGQLVYDDTFSWGVLFSVLGVALTLFGHLQRRRDSDRAARADR